MRSAVLLWAGVLAQGDEYKEGQLCQHRYRELVTPFVTRQSDTRKYLGLVLANGMEVLLISDPAAKISAAALDVAVGSKADPKDMQGMAHFCKHLLFTSSTKYPGGTFTEFVEANGGETNAYTAYENTNYHFSVRPRALDGALDRFAQFFIAPTFKKAVLESEAAVVESHLVGDLQSEFFRIEQVSKLLSNQSHPFNSYGNKQTLYDGPISKCIDPRQKVKEFFNTHYSANLMSLVVMGSQSLEALKELVIPKFTAVPDKKASTFSVPGSPFSNSQLGIQVGVESLSDDHALILQIPLPSSVSQYRTKPERFLKEVLGAEGPGSVKGLLLKKRWLYSAEVYIKKYKEFGLLEMDLGITAAGLQNKEAIVQMYLDYARLATQKDLKYIYDEMKELAEIEFQRGESPDPLSLVHKLASGMKTGSLSETLSLGLLKEFDARLIKETFGQVLLDKARLLVISKSPTNKLKHPVYDINYSKQKLNPHHFKTSCDRLELPKPNPYIPRNFTLLKTDPAVVALKKSPRGSLWYAGNPTTAPKAVVLVLLQRVPENPKAKAALAMLVCALELDLSGTTRAAQGSGLSIKILATNQGLLLHFEGYNDRMEKIIKETMHQVKTTGISEDTFLHAKERTLLSYSLSSYLSPKRQAAYSTRMALENNTWPYPTLNITATSTSHKDFQTFVVSVLRARSRVLAVGNLSKKTASRIGEFPLPAKAPTKIAPSAAVVMPRGDFVFRFPLANTDEQNSAILFYLEMYIYPNSPTESTCGFMAFLLNTQAFNQLRSKEQLGHDVQAAVHDLGSRGGIAFSITSVYDPVHLESRIGALLVSFRKSLTDMSDKELRELIKGYASSPKATTLKEKAEEIWYEIRNDSYSAPKDEDIRRELDSITKDKLLVIMDARMLKGGCERRKFSTHAVSRLARKPKGDYTLEKCGCRITNPANWTRTTCPSAKK